MKTSSFRSITTTFTAILCFPAFGVVDSSSAAGLRRGEPNGASAATKQPIVSPDITTTIPKIYARDVLGLYLKKEEEENGGDNYAYISSDGKMHIVIQNDIDRFVKSYGMNGFPVEEESTSLHITCNIDGRDCFMDLDSTSPSQSAEDDGTDENNQQRSLIRK